MKLTITIDHDIEINGGYCSKHCYYLNDKYGECKLFGDIEMETEIIDNTEEFIRCNDCLDKTVYLCITPYKPPIKKIITPVSNKISVNTVIENMDHKNPLVKYTYKLNGIEYNLLDLFDTRPKLAIRLFTRCSHIFTWEERAMARRLVDIYLASNKYFEYGERNEQNRF